jgi:hypothetical protein
MISQTLVYRASAANIITSGCTVKVLSGTYFNSTDDLQMNSGSDLIIQGTLVLKKNLVNLNSSPDSLGSGTIEFSGTTNQTISGQNIINNLTVNNSNGLSVSGNTRISGTFSLTSGRITLGSNNLSLGPSSSFNGIPSASNMIVPAGSGQLQKEFPSSFTGGYTFPVGDTTGTAEYSPVLLNFVSGTFASGNYAGLKLVNNKYPNDSITGSYVKRYWTLSQSGISSFSCNATFTYVPADVVGTESAVFCTRVSPSPWITYSAANVSNHQLIANGLNSGTFTGTYTGMRGAADVSLIAYLEGPYNTGTGYMNTTLKTNNLLPLTQPYNTSPFNYAGAESVTSIPADVVDWVLIELRQASTPANATSSTIIKKRAAFMKKDGTIVETDGSSPVRFYNAAITTNLYPVVRQRNHIAIMAANAVTMASGVYTYDFSSGIGQAYGGAVGYKQIGTSPPRYGMVTGDINQDGSVYTSDFDIWAGLAGTANVYNHADLNMDGNVYTSDFDQWATNSGMSHPLGAPVKIKYLSGVPQ